MGSDRAGAFRGEETVTGREWKLSLRRVGWGTVCAALAVLTAPRAMADDQIVGIQGPGAEIERSDGQWQSASPLPIQIGPRDLVYPIRGSAVTVRCDNGNSPPPRTSLFGLADVCPDSVSSRYSPDGRGEDDFLLFLEDRFEYASQVLAERPILRWNPAEGAANYALELRDCGSAVFNCGAVLWETTSAETEVVYTGSPLEPGRNYELQVVPLSREGEEILEATAYLTLRRLDEEQIESVQTALAQIEAAGLDEDTAAIARTRVYLGVAEPETLPPDGVGLLLAALETLPDGDNVYLEQLIGDIYLQVGLLDQAEAAYREALAQNDNPAMLAAAQVGLANIAAAQGDRAVAAAWLHQALGSYATAADVERLNQVEDWLAALAAFSER